MDTKKTIRNFFFPSITMKFFVRASFMGLLACIFFYYICIPVKISGASMEPSYRDGSVNLTWRLRYTFSSPKRYDVVAVRFAGSRVMLLKRVVALEGEELEFRDGKLLVNGKELDEPYIKYPCNWNLPPRQVQKGNVYIIGDNRSMPLNQHTFGQTSIKRIIGAPVW